MIMHKVSAFCQGDQGGNPAGVVITDKPLSIIEMAQIAKRVGYSETAFAVAEANSQKSWRVRYFSPRSEVPFCGHATIALGSVLAKQFGNQIYKLTLNQTSITVSATDSDDGPVVSLSSPATKSNPINGSELSDTLSLFTLSSNDLDQKLASARIHAGANHIALILKSRDTLAQMSYSLETGHEVMKRHGLVTIMLVYIEDNQTFVVRNAFASGGVVEDPATGAAAAAFAGYLRDQHWPHNNKIVIRQGEDMGQPSRIEVRLSDVQGSSVEVSGLCRTLD